MDSAGPIGRLFGNEILMDGMGAENPPRASRRLLRRCALALLGASSAAVLVSTGFTYATLSDSASGGVTATAATVVLGGEGDTAFDLAYPKLKPGETQEGTLTVRYEGSVSAEVSVALADGYSPFCGDHGEPLADFAPLRMAIEVPGEPVSEIGYCDLLKHSVSLGKKFTPGEAREISIAVTLSDPAPGDYRNRSSTDVLIVRAAHGFTDRIEGSIAIDIADFGSDPVDTPTSKKPTDDATSQDQQHGSLVEERQSGIEETTASVEAPAYGSAPELSAPTARSASPPRGTSSPQSRANEAQKLENMSAAGATSTSRDQRG